MRALLLAAVLTPVAWFGGAALGAGVLQLAAGTAETEMQEATVCGRQLPGGGDDRQTSRARSTRVVLAVDEDWQAEFQAEATVVAKALLWEAASLFRGFNIHFLPLRVERWTSPDELDSAEELMHLARESIPRGEADIVVVLTGQQPEHGDGYAEVGGRYALVSHHPGRPKRDAMVLAHEIAHVFGAVHYCDLLDHSGVMAKKGFEEPDLVCPCTQQILERNADRFHQR